MILRSEETSTEFEFGVLGYQFPHKAEDEWDSNWLLVNIRISPPQGSWSVTDPCLLTWESHWLLNWLADVALGDRHEDMSFLESNILFQLTGTSEDTVHLRVELKDELSQRGLMTEEAEPPILLAVSVPEVRQAVESFVRSRFVQRSLGPAVRIATAEPLACYADVATARRSARSNSGKGGSGSAVVVDKRRPYRRLTLAR